MQKNSYSLGVIAEQKAIQILKEKGFFILFNRFQVGYGLDAGEIDLIAVNNSINLLLFIEVKKRKNFDLALLSISNIQMQRIYNSAEVFIAQHPEYDSFDCRFDVIAFNDDFDFEYIENAWGFN